MADHEEQCNCDQALELCKLLAQARDIIMKTHAFAALLPERHAWVKKTESSWAFQEPEVQKDDSGDWIAMLKSFERGRVAFQEYLQSRDVEYRLTDDGIKFKVDGEHWLAEFWSNGKYKQLVWT